MAPLRRLDGVRIFEQLAIADPVIAAYLSIHNMCAWMIDSYGTEEQRKTWVPQLAPMTAVASYCLTEPGAGSDASALSTRAVRSGPDRTQITCSTASSSSSPAPGSRTCMW
ncbi:hypothetical protein MSEN_25250 [Mycolicibacter senuensis]|uniref:Acyl-CoA dehydrogenase/oxidase N-terminal domain-containing protein n=1 Tax=Mycolicibacter senuensis TaxID=386913 RepID=A0A7I9XLH9_9MYCO|nr:hypothetical protein MSEN_25250 [Mycolicibacter senuensis]